MNKSCFLAATVFAFSTLSFTSAQAASGFDASSAPSSLRINVMAEAGQDEHAGAKGFVQGLTKRGIDFLSDESLSDEDRKKEFEQLLRSSFDLKAIGRFTLGRYWKDASKQQQQEYLKLFEQSIVNSYAKRFAEYQGQNVEVRGAQVEEGQDAIVNSVIVAQGKPEVRVDWRIRQSGKSYKVVDVIVEGVSMAVTQRSDFASVIQRGGGDLNVLLDHLRQQ